MGGWVSGGERMNRELGRYEGMEGALGPVGGQGKGLGPGEESTDLAGEEGATVAW